jgi:N-acetylmuramic acid 6-phosphate etherase
MNGEDAAVPTAVAQRLPQIAAAIDAIAERMARGGRLIYAGAGTAGRLGVLDASECPPTFNTDPSQVVGLIAGGPEAMVVSVEGAEDSKDLARTDLDALALTPTDTVVGISASGRTPYAIGAVEHARKQGALTIGLSCNPDSALAAAAEHGIEIVVGPELLTGSTRLKAGTAQKLVLNMLSTITMIRLGKTYGNLMVDVRASNDKLRARSRRIVALATGADDADIERALTEAGGEVKTAILILLADVDGPTANGLLDSAEGHLRAAMSAGGRTDGR